MILRFFIRTYGCQMNERDSENLACLLQAQGLEQVLAEQDADVLIFNTCSVRDQAERKAVGKIGLMKRLKQHRPELIIAVVGCMAQSRGQNLLDELPHVDIVLGPDQLQQLPDKVKLIRRQRGKVVDVQFGDDVWEMPPEHMPGRISGFVAVMRGCNQFCTYCIVPHVRGREKSRPVAEIVTEVQKMVAQGTKEVMLLGQNVTAYGVAELGKSNLGPADACPFAELLGAVNAVAGLERIRFTSPHPHYMNQAFVEAIAGLPKVCEAFHLPLQSGSNRMLAAMRRGYSIEEYLQRVQWIRQALPSATFSTDVIVGFPGESAEDFAQTRAVMEDVGFDMAYIFKYSPRRGTRAADLADDVATSVKEQRNQVLLADLAARVARQNQAFVGQQLEVLVEGPSKRNPDRWTGRARNNKTCLFPPQPGLYPGELRTILVERVTPTSLFGQLLA